MSRNTSTGAIDLVGNLRIRLLIIALIGVACLPGCRLATVGVHDHPDILGPTSTAEATLTEKHGTEIRAIIEDFETVWASLGAHQDPSIQAHVASGPYLQHQQSDGASLSAEPFWLVVTSADVVELRVISYNHDQFKAVASVARIAEKLSPNGQLLESPAPINPVCAVYVFAREGEDWKLMGRGLTFGLPDDVSCDWDRTIPQWHKDILGDRPDGVLCTWFEELY